MRVLVNYDKNDKRYISGLAYLLKNHGHTAMSTSEAMTIHELVSKAQMASCTAILLCNPQTLRSCVPGDNPSLDKWRGSRLNTSVPILILNSLSHIHTVNHGEWLMNKDLEKLRYIGYNFPEPFSYKVLENEDDFGYALSRIAGSIATAYDIETATPKLTKDEELARGEGVPTEVGFTRITCSSWTAIMPSGKLETYVLPLVDFSTDHWVSNKSYENALLFMRRANATSVPKIMHNGMYDCMHSLIYQAPPMNFCYDTMAMAHAQYAELPKTLDFVASYNLPDYIFWKDDSVEAAAAKDIQKYWGYNAKDTWYTARIAMQQLKLAPAHARRNYADKFFLVYPALYCNFEGMKIDQSVRIAKRTASLTQLTRARGLLKEMFADPSFNPGSWQQVEKYIYTVFGAKKPGIGKSKSGTDEKNLIAVGEQHPLLARLTTEILDYREAQKAIGTYYDFLQKNGRLLWSLNPFGTETERMACTASSLWCGTQVQNIPSYAKGMLIADDGYELVEVDNSQSEARCTAYCAEELALITALEDATRDFYRTLGTLFFNIPYEQVSDFFRNKVLKKIVHGTNYMMAEKTFIENATYKILFEAALSLGITIVEIPKKNHPKQMTMRQFAKSLLDVYHKPFPGIRKWYERIKNEIATTGRLVSPLGHVREFFGDVTKDHKILRGGVAHQPQNLSVSILNKGFKRAYNEIVIPSAGEFRLKAQIHDSILGQYPTIKRDLYVPWLTEVMKNPVIVHGRTLRIPLDAKYGKNWDDTTKYKFS